MRVGASGLEPRSSIASLPGTGPALGDGCTDPVLGSPVRSQRSRRIAEIAGKAPAVEAKPLDANVLSPPQSINLKPAGKRESGSLQFKLFAPKAIRAWLLAGLRRSP